MHLRCVVTGLNDLYPFDPKKKVIEYMLHDEKANPLVNMNMRGFANELASESVAPGLLSASLFQL